MERQSTVENGNGNSVKIWLKLPWEQRPLPVYFDTIRWGKHCIVKAFFLDPKRTPLEFAGPPALVTDALRALIDKIEGRPASEWAPTSAAPEADDDPPEVDPVIKEAGLTLADVPTDPAEGWPWLLKHCPQLFDGIFVSREPYAMYLKPQPVNQLERDVTKLLPIADTLRRGDRWNQSAIAQELGWPNTGGSYRRRILDIISELERRAA